MENKFDNNNSIVTLSKKELNFINGGFYWLIAPAATWFASVIGARVVGGAFTQVMDQLVPRADADPKEIQAAMKRGTLMIAIGVCSGMLVRDLIKFTLSTCIDAANNLFFNSTNSKN